MSASFPHTPSAVAFDLVQLVCIDIECSGVLGRSTGGVIVRGIARSLIGVERVRGVEQGLVGQRQVLYRVSGPELARSSSERLALTSWAMGTDCSQRGVGWYAVAMSCGGL
jgi:hypothetical protein